LSLIGKKLSDVICRLLGIKKNPAEDRQNLEVEMLESLERASTSGDIDLEEDERKMIHSIFELGDTAAREIMVPRIRIEYLKENDTLEDILKLVEETGFSRFPLTEDGIDKILGIIYVKDVFLNMEDLKSGKIKLKDIIRRPIVVPEGKLLDELLRDMKKLKTHFAIVIDEYGGTAGMVTIEDIVEEIVGEIEDEYDTELPPIREVKPGHYIVDANLSIEELNETIDTGLPDEIFETVGGFIYDQVGSLPSQGHVVEKGNLKMIVEKIDGQRIISVRIIVNQDGKDKKDIDAENR
jgi:CBS domain containing-hemolysin-like protein